MKRVFLILSFIFVFIFPCWGKDPFKNLLPEKQKEPVLKKTEGRSYEVRGEDIPIDINLEGVFWDISPRQVIINGEVYKEGDTLKGIEAEISRIEKNQVSLIYKGRVFIISPQKKKEGRR